MKTTNIIHLLTVSFLIMLSACVGKIDEAQVPVNSQFQPDPVYFDYRGIETALPIAHDKVELSFARALGSTDDIVYKLYINDAADPITLGLENLTTHFGGRYYYVVKGLNINTLYSFKIRAFKIAEGAESKSENTKQARTYNNTVADFSGIGNLAPVAGLEDKAIEVSWDRVPYIFGLIPSKKDPVKYLISYSLVSPDDLFNPASLTRKEIPVDTELPATHPSSTIISDLTQNKTYFFAVRAIHSGYQDYINQGASYIPIDKERNTKFLSLKTSATLDWTTHTASKSQVQNAKGERGYYDISTSWDRAKGSYTGYKILYRRFDEYDGTAQSLTNFDLNASVINSIVAQGSNNATKGIITCLNQKDYSCPGGNTQKQISNLTPGAWYHVKVFICELTNTSCPLIKDDGTTLNKSYNLMSIRINPSLSSFMGINSIQNPTSELADDEVTLEFSPPDTTNGWADTMNFYCLDTLNIDSQTNQYLISGTRPETALQNAGNCTGIYRADFSNSAISSMTSLSIRGAVLGQEYTFTASPEYNRAPFNGINGINPVTYPPLERIKRTISPDIISPTISQFSGLTSCQVDGVNKTISANWLPPTGGIYQDYVFFWKAKSASGSPFNFTTAMAEYKNRVDAGGPTDYTDCAGEVYCHKKISKGTLTSSTLGLNHGTYELGVQTLFKKNTYYKWSQPNTNVKRCEIKIPRATFQEWTRIFAIGPKESHLNESNKKYTREGLLFTGIPWEIGTNSVVGTFFQPPGEKLTETTVTGTSQVNIDLSQVFDGAKSTALGSNSGIISIAWTEFILDNSLDQGASSDWKTESDGVPRALRKYGYKVYRSKDNRISWDDVTLGNVIHARPYSFYHRPNIQLSPPTNMAFFTDYSVSNLENLNGIEQARVYWYKIVPIFNGAPMEITNPKAAMIQVTLPPPNMALVHRWMANRAQCLELGLTPNPNDNYSCNFTGLGAVPKTVPFTAFQTKIDLKGDLLVDRFELGCNYSRGDVSNQAAPEYTNKSDFSESTFSRQGCYKVATSSLPSTNDKFTNQIDNPLPGQIDITPNTNTAPDPSTANLNSYLLRGDCIGNSAILHPANICTADQALRSNGTANSRWFSSPGYQNIYPFPSPQNPGSCLTDSMETKMLNFSWVKSNLAQSQFGAVYHNSSTDYGYSNPVIYNNNGTYQTNTTWSNSASCSINLAAINSGEYLPRWVDLNALDKRINPSISLDKTPTQLIAEASTNKLYDSTGLLPSQIPESIASKKLGLILTTNKAGTPPLMYVDRDTGKKVCNLYQVRQAFKSEDGSNGTVIPIGSIKNKRLLRKREFMASNLWPELYQQSQIDLFEGVKGSLNDPERGFIPSYLATQDKSCVNTQTLNASLGLQRWSIIPQRIKAGHPHLSGSNINFQCTSRFGIQDLIGNQKEMSSDIIFCDYSPIRLLWGKCKGNRSSTGKCDEINDTSDPHVVLNSPAFYPPGSTQAQANYYMLSQGNPLATAPGNFSIENKRTGLVTGVNPSSTETDIGGDWGYYISLGDNAGYCSMTDDDSERRSDTNIDWEQDYFSDFFFKTINLNLVPKAPLLSSEDSGSPYTFRDGSGHFLDFGDSHMTIPNAVNDSLVLPWRYEGNTISGRNQNSRSSVDNYPMISTLLGIPLMCGSTPSADWGQVCKEHNVFVMDTKTHQLALEKKNGLNNLNPITVIPFPISNDSANPLPQSSITDFNVGGSYFKSAGLSGIYSNRLIHSSTQLNNIPEFFTGVVYNADGTTTIQKGTQTDYNDLEIFEIQWNIQRGQKMLFSQGGHFNKSVDTDGLDITHNGRFSNDLGPETTPGVESGVRCGVMINEVE